MTTPQTANGSTEIANADMAAHWDGAEGDEWADNAEQYDNTGRYINDAFNTAVAIHTTDHVLDIGCGTGMTTRDAARAASQGTALGIDLSTRMLDYARTRAAKEGLTNVEFVRADAQVHPLAAGSFDVAISSFGAMFFNDPVAAFANIRRSLRDGGRLALMTWQPFERNEWLTVMFESLGAGRNLPTPSAGHPGPFGLADEAAVRLTLEQAGYTSVELTPLAAPMWFGADTDAAWEFVLHMGIVRGLTGGLEPAARADALARLHDEVAAHETSDGVLLGASEWVITAQSLTS